MSTVQLDKSSNIATQAMGFPMRQILRRYCKDYDVPLKVALEHERELKRYLMMAALNPDANYGMAGQVDNLWHTFILFTKEYAEFCNMVAGRFIHHVPSTDDAKKSDCAKGYNRFLVDYKVIFRESPPKHVWPRIVKQDPAKHKQSGISCGTGCGYTCYKVVV
jgi:hypothetical protein